MRRLVCCALLILLGGLASPALAYGPSIHMRELERFITMSELQPPATAAFSPDLLRRQWRYLMLGAFWPDLARLLVNARRDDGVDENLVDPHNRHFVMWLLDNALAQPPENEWQVAFAQGNLGHCAGDSVSQDMFVEYEAVVAHFGAMDILPSMAAGAPDGLNEDLVEGGLEFMEPALSYYLVMVDDFLTTDAGRQELSTVLTFYLAAYHEYFPNARVLDADRALPLVLDALADFPRRFPPCAPRGSPALRNFARGGFRDRGRLAGGAVDWQELTRFLTGPAITQAFWDRYYDEGYFDFSPTMLLTFADGQPFFDDFPNWSEPLMRASVLQSLAYYLPGRLTPNRGRFLFDLGWFPDGANSPVTSIDAAAPPVQIVLTATFIDSLDAASVSPWVTLVVREDSAAATVVASATGDVANDPHFYNVNPPRTLSVAFDPAPSIAAGANGFFAELHEGKDPGGPLDLTTNWDIYTQITGIDMTQDVYTSQYAVYGQWPYSLQIDDPPTTTAGGRREGFLPFGRQDNGTEARR